ncbi:MAG: AAA family ATPase [Gemmobacter sp.]|nr:AAA family ATPase [Gemmobacter sp.]
MRDHTQGGTVQSVQQRRNAHGTAVPEREWLVRGLVPEKTATLSGGNGGPGKSLLACNRP